jgi:hypothetical protein
MIRAPVENDPSLAAPPEGRANGSSSCVPAADPLRADPEAKEKREYDHDRLLGRYPMGGSRKSGEYHSGNLDREYREQPDRRRAKR